LNILLEAFHRWARAQGLGVSVAGSHIPSTSFADDVVLVARCQAEMEALISAYLAWCRLLGLTVTKVQVWWSGREPLDIQVGSEVVRTVPLFKVVGVVLGAKDAAATKVHLERRLPKAMATLQRLRAIDLPASVAALLWKTTILPQAVYGCEVRNVTRGQVARLAVAGRAMLATKAPLHLNSWRAPEVMSGPAFGDTALLDPMAEVRRRQLSWMHLLVNLPCVVGAVHREVAWREGSWQEPTASLRTAMAEVGWNVRRNLECSRSSRWPLLDPEPRYEGEVELIPQDVFPLEGAVFTDGSVVRHGGAAAVQPDTEKSLWAQLPDPRSSTHCELAALCLAMGFETTLVLTDSLAALSMLRSWGSWSPMRVLRCSERAEVRRILEFADRRSLPPPRLEKVKAHNEQWLRLQHPMAMGNDQADALAKEAATNSAVPPWPPPEASFQDPVELVAGDGSVVMDVLAALPKMQWLLSRRQRVHSRRWLDILYPEDIAIMWEISTILFRRPTSSGDAFVHWAAPATIKWVARVRAGCLATRLRLWERKLVSSASCPGCGAVEEDDEHVVLGCPATGTADWLQLVVEAWQTAASSTKLETPVPPQDWLHLHRAQLMAALIPSSVGDILHLPPPSLTRFLRRLHLLLAGALAECLRRREALIATRSAAPSGEVGLCDQVGPRLCSLPMERQLSVATLRQVEIARRQVGPPLPLASPPRTPVSGEPRRLWLRSRLVTMLQEEMDPCPAVEGVNSEALVEYFERLTGEAFSASPGVSVLSRVSGMGRTMTNVWQQETFTPALQRHVGRGGRLRWNRRPRGTMVDLVAWRRQAEASEAAAAPVPRLRGRVAAVNAELVSWLRQHRHLVPAGSEDPSDWESGMALLLLWEVDHAQEFVTGGGEGATPKLLGFTRRLQSRVPADAELSAWLRWADVAAPLMRGLPPTHHTRWSVRILAPKPPSPRGWYDEFLRRWQAYASSLAGPPGALIGPETPPMSLEVVGLRRSLGAAENPAAKRQQRVEPPAAVAMQENLVVEATSSSSTTSPEGERRQEAMLLQRPTGRRPRSTEKEPSAKRRTLMDLREWLTQAPEEPVVEDRQLGVTMIAGSGHGRAVQGPST
jgi:hypothetical protein